LSFGEVLGKLESSPDVADRFFDWVLESDDSRLSYKSYNLMLEILGVNGFVKEFWDLVEVMNKNGYGNDARVKPTLR
jgi:pentatricopeptide repeat protein